MSYRILVLSIVIISIFGGCSKDKSTDPTPNACTEVTIGSQVWMCRNLDVDHYRNGDSIPEVKDSTEWNKLTTGAWCYYNNDPANGAIYGKLYNWYAVNDLRGLAPAGWHVPINSEWETLVSYLGGEFAGGKMKESSTAHWINPNTGATNLSGFTALPGGFRVYDDNFIKRGLSGYWWSSSNMDYWSPSDAEAHSLDYNFASGAWWFGPKECGLSVRCIHD